MELLRRYASIPWFMVKKLFGTENRRRQITFRLRSSKQERRYVVKETGTISRHHCLQYYKYRWEIHLGLLYLHRSVILKQCNRFTASKVITGDRVKLHQVVFNGRLRALLPEGSVISNSHVHITLRNICTMNMARKVIYTQTSTVSTQTKLVLNTIYISYMGAN
jgi:hypothetical protein